MSDLQNAAQEICDRVAWSPDSSVSDLANLVVGLAAAVDRLDEEVETLRRRTGDHSNRQDPR